MADRLNLSPRAEWSPAARRRDADAVLPCRPSCCKSPYGHSTVRDHLPATHKDACHCHDPRPKPTVWDEAEALKEDRA